MISNSVTWRVLSLAAAAVAATLLPCVAASANPIDLPAAEFDICLGVSSFSPVPCTTIGIPVDLQRFTSPGTYTFSTDNSDSIVTTTVAGLPRPSMNGHVDVVNDGRTWQIRDVLTYSFAVEAPVAGLQVPMGIRAVWHMSLTGDPRITDQVYLEVDGSEVDGPVGISSFFGTLCNPAIRCRGVEGRGPDFVGVIPFVALTENVNTVIAILSVLGTGFLDGGSGDVFIDPYIFIDPDFLSSHPGYSVIVSEGIGNAPPGVTGVPEPATLTLVGLGLVGMGLSRRRHLRKS